jgi:hypothetical protein
MMDENTKQLIKYGAMAAAAYFVYQWLQNSGLWAQWFGGASATSTNSFNTSTALLSYCQANPTGTAVYVDPSTGASSTATCAQWLASNSNATLPPAASPASGLAPNYQQAISLMQAAVGNDSQDLDNWAYYWQNATPFEGAPDGFGVANSIAPSQMDQIVSLNGGNRGAAVSAEQFVAWINQTTPSATPASGTAGLANFYDYGAEYNQWVN